MSDNNNEMDMLLNHDYDGIKEYDNPLPNWWLMTFFGTIIFGFIYWIHYEFGGGLSLADEHKKNVAQILAVTSSTGVSEEKFKTASEDPSFLESGKTVYAGKCAVCHGDKGQGLIGPNLTDNFWLHGKGAKADIASTIANGVVEKGMPAWQALLSEKELVGVSLHVAALRGTTPPNPKAPQGQEYP